MSGSPEKSKSQKMDAGHLQAETLLGQKNELK